MQYNNPDGKWLEEIPYMIINLEHDRHIYLGKDTVVAYTREEDKSCDYLEINEIVELADLKKEFSTKGKRIVESDLVFSPAQVTEHRCVELKDQEITKEKRERFEKLNSYSPTGQCMTTGTTKYFRQVLEGSGPDNTKNRQL